MEDNVDYSKYEHLLVEVKDRIGLITINRPDKLNATNARLHWELSKIWLDLAEDDDVRVIVITGAGRAFSAGGDFQVLEEGIGNADVVARLFKEDRAIVHNMINIDKPVISAINGHAVGAGCAVALLADISIAGESARILDGHIILGVAAGDHAALIWPLQVGMAKAKLYLLTGEAIDGKEAERIGLVSKVVPDDELMPTAMAIAEKLARGAGPGDPVDQAVAQPVAAPGGDQLLRLLGGAGDAGFHGPRRAGRARGPQGEAAAELPVAPRYSPSIEASPMSTWRLTGRSPPERNRSR